MRTGFILVNLLLVCVCVCVFFSIIIISMLCSGFCCFECISWSFKWRVFWLHLNGAGGSLLLLFLLLLSIDLARNTHTGEKPMKWTRLPNVSHFMCICRWVGRWLAGRNGWICIWNEMYMVKSFAYAFFSCFFFRFFLISLNLHHFHLICGPILSGWPF